MNLKKRVESYIIEHELLDNEKVIIVGVSGGADSVVLLYILLALGYQCIVAHCNFKLRMDASDNDSEFVRSMAKSLGLSHYSIDFDTVGYAKERKISIEMAARDLRYEWFHKLLNELDAQAIAVAHHADDSIETMLMNLVRGTGLRGLTGIHPKNGKVVRPLLCCTRSEIEAYLEEHKLSHVEDASNAELDYTRNKFRNLILPLLEEINPSVRQVLYQTTERLEGILTIYQRAIKAIQDQVVSNEGDRIKINIELLTKSGHVPTVLYEILHPYGFSSGLIEIISSQLNCEAGKSFYSDSHRLVKDRDSLILQVLDYTVSDEYEIDESQVEIEIPILLKFNKFNKSDDFKFSESNACVHLDFSKLKFPLVLRKWKMGDAFYPLGMNQRKKLSDFFIDNKLSVLEKEHIWLIVSGTEIVWVIGYRIDNRYRIEPNTTTIFEITCSNYK
jgi:tRNA(Ile)-lysidine synthase